MTTSTLSSSPKFNNADDWWHALGDVPLKRIVMDPLPGTATEKDLLAFIEHDKRLVELVDGTLVEKPMGWWESLIALRLAIALGNFIHPRHLGFLSGPDGSLRMASGRVHLPDLAFVSVDDLPGGTIPREPIPTLRLTLAVEVLSDSNTSAEMRQKIKEYFEAGCKLVWLVNPALKTIEVFDRPSEKPGQILNENDMLDGGKVLPGFAFAVAELFAPAP